MSALLGVFVDRLTTMFGHGKPKARGHDERPPAPRAMLLEHYEDESIEERAFRLQFTEALRRCSK